jgi:hypothetical protein
MKDRTALSIVCLHISAVAYVLLGVFFLLLARLVGTFESYGSGLTVFFLLICLSLAAGVEILVVGLKRRRFWAWIVGIIVTGTYVPSLFLPLGALGLWGLLAAGSRKSFGVGAPPVTEGQPAAARLTEHPGRWGL